MRKCRTCHIYTQTIRFPYRKSNHLCDVVKYTCDTCHKLNRRRRDPQRNSRYKHTYGITLDQYNVMLKSQQGRCAICRRPQKDLFKHLSIDHCHKTGNIRGLLCIPCNLGLGSFKDCPDLLRHASNYLRQTTTYKEPIR